MIKKSILYISYDSVTVPVKNDRQFCVKERFTRFHFQVWDFYFDSCQFISFENDSTFYNGWEGWDTLFLKIVKVQNNKKLLCVTEFRIILKIKVSPFTTIFSSIILFPTLNIRVKRQETLISIKLRTKFDKMVKKKIEFQRLVAKRRFSIFKILADLIAKKVF